MTLALGHTYLSMDKKARRFKPFSGYCTNFQMVEWNEKDFLS
jgi:hypothetical protein